MPLRNGEHGYGGVTKLLHWLTVSAILGQFLVGYRMALDHSGHGRGRGHGEGSGHGRGGGGDHGYEDLFQAGLGLPELHVSLGVLVLGLGVLRVLWRFVGALPPWAPALSHVERTLESWLERALILMLFVIPASGLLLVLSGEDDYLPLHIAAHIAFFVLVGLHLGLVLKHTVIQRDRHLARML